MGRGRRQRQLRSAIYAATMTTLAIAADARASCLSLKSGPIIYDVQGCGAIQPEQHFDTSKDKYSWVAGLDPAGRKRFYDSYRGLYLKGKVVKSNASEKGLSGEAGVLSGDDILMFVPPGQQSCPAVIGKRLAGQLQEVCCDGGGDPPCLLNTSYVL
jgi:hypothetical protein